jgi:hypothetical protein
MRGFHAPRETRTPTRETPHKALNRVEGVSVPSSLSEFGFLELFAWTHRTPREQHLLPRLLPRRLERESVSTRAANHLGY